MKKVLLVLALVTALMSCKKTWTCTVVTTSEFSSIVTTVDFKGTKEEAQYIEDNGTTEMMGVSQTTTCN